MFAESKYDVPKGANDAHSQFDPKVQHEMETGGPDHLSDVLPVFDCPADPKSRLRPKGRQLVEGDQSREQSVLLSGLCRWHRAWK